MQKYLVDGLLSVATHNGVHRLVFYELSETESPQAQPRLELAIPESALPSIVETLASLANHEPGSHVFTSPIVFDEREAA
jgi:hypothetical protein